MADTPLIGRTVHGQGTVIPKEKTGPEIHFCSVHKGDGDSELYWSFTTAARAADVEMSCY